MLKEILLKDESYNVFPALLMHLRRRAARPWLTPCLYVSTAS